MPGPSYDLDYQSPSRPPAPGRKLRLAALFVGVAAIMGAGIWLLLPRTETPDAAPGTPPSDSGSAVTAERLPDSLPEVLPTDLPPTGSDPVVDPEIAEGEKSPLPDAQPDPVPETPVETADGGSENAPESALPPEKGVPHPSDPPRDEPRIAPDAIEPYGFARNLKSLQLLMEASRPADAQARARAMLPELTEYSRQWRETVRVLSAASLARYAAGPATAGGARQYRVKSGDSLYRIARAHGVSVDALLRWNHLSPDHSLIKVGQTLVVGSAGWRIVINRSARMLKLYDGETLFAAFDIGVGRNGQTPLGAFKIIDKVADPSYRAPDGRVIPPGDPANQLGRHFLKLGAAAKDGADAPQGYGIHGTADESTVTRSLSNGCLRMRNAEAEALFSIVPTGTPVLIEE